MTRSSRTGETSAKQEHGKPKVIFIVGPTAIGKTSISIKLAKKIGGEVISADSMQVYKGIEMLSQAASKEERGQVPHHLISMIDPRKEYSVASFRRRAGRLVSSILKRGKVPIVAGGSGLYVKGLVDGLFPSPEPDEEFRAKMYGEAEKLGSPALHQRLAQADPGSARNIHPNDTRRIIRALEIIHSTGKTMTELKAKTRGIADKYDIRIFGLTAPREEIYSRINARVEMMIKSGAVDEAARLAKKKLSKTAASVLGLKELLSYIEGKLDLDTAKEEMAKNTRNFAKRQMTWFKADNRVVWFDISANEPRSVVSRICAELKR